MRCNRVNGFLSLGVILYLSTFPLGKAQTNCTALGNQCGSSQPDCCEGLTCFAETESSPTCVPCTTHYNQCTEGPNRWPDCCAPMLCIEGWCKYCTVQNNSCGLGQSNCCEGLTCFSNKCQNCTAENDTCTTDDDAKSCCGTMLCFGGQCKPCTVQDDVCGLSQPDCCEGLTCSTENSTTSTCQNCTAENDTCTTDDDAKSCCGTMLCFGGQCKPCTVQDDVCGRDQPDCCEVLTSFAENSTTS
eukprot:75561_1